MRLRERMGLAFLAGLAILFACSPPSDIGNPCVLRQDDGGVWTDAQSATDDFLNTGSPGCEDFVCIRAAGSTLDAGSGVCSSPCTPQTPSDPNSPSDDCNSQSTGLVCRTVTLPPALIQALQAEDGGAAILKGLESDYCTSPTTSNSSS